MPPRCTMLHMQALTGQDKRILGRPRQTQDKGQDQDRAKRDKRGTKDKIMCRTGLQDGQTQDKGQDQDNHASHAEQAQAHVQS